MRSVALVLLAISRDGVPDRRDAREIVWAEADDALSPFDVLRGDAHLLHEGLPRRAGLVCHPLGPPLRMIGSCGGDLEGAPRALHLRMG